MNQRLSSRKLTHLLHPRGADAPTRDHLSELILQMAEHSPYSVLVEDYLTRFTGSRILKFIRSMRSHLEAISYEGSRVAVFFPNSAVQAIGILAVLYAKRVPIIVNPDLPAEKIEEQLRQFQCSLIIASPESECAKFQLPKIFVSLTGEFLEIKSLAMTRWQPVPDPKVALILFTSGSTGHPKAVQLTTDGLFYTVRFLRKYLSLDHKTKAGVTLPIYHTMALNTQFFPTFFSGGRTVFMNSESDKRRTYELILESESNFLTLIGDLLFLFQKERELRNLPLAQKVRHLQMAGGIIRKDHLLLARELFPNARLYKGYGLTESIRTAMIDSDQPEFLEDVVGRILPGQDIQIRSEKGRVLAPGQTGQIHIRGPNLMMGYQGEKSAFDENGYFATGDLGFIDARGLLHFSGRTDEIFKTLGKKVSTLEIEKTALGLDFVEMAKCICVPCAKKGLKAVLFVKAAASSEVEKIEDLCRTVRNYLFDQLEKYKVPSDVLVIDEFPKLSNQKVNRRAVYDLWLEWEAQRG